MANRLAVFGGAMFVASLALAADSRADTISYADAVTVLAKDCGTDIKKFCKGLNLGGGRIQDCLAQNASKVSPVCTTTLATVITSIKQRQAAQVAYTKICQHDMSQYCNGVKGEGYVLACLLKTKPASGGKCGQAITDAGWR